MMNKFIIGAIAAAAVLSAGFAFSIIYLVEDDEESQISSMQEDYVEDYLVGDKEQLYEMHDVIVDATVTSFSNETVLEKRVDRLRIVRENDIGEKTFKNNLII